MSRYSTTVARGGTNALGEKCMRTASAYALEYALSPAWVQIRSRLALLPNNPQRPVVTVGSLIPFSQIRLEYMVLWAIVGRGWETGKPM